MGTIFILITIVTALVIFSFSNLWVSTVIAAPTTVTPDHCRSITVGSTRLTNWLECCHIKTETINNEEMSSLECKKCATDPETNKRYCSGYNTIREAQLSGQANNEGNAGIIQEPPKKGSQDTNIGNNGGILIDRGNLRNNDTSNATSGIIQNKDMINRYPIPEITDIH